MSGIKMRGEGRELLGFFFLWKSGGGGGGVRLGSPIPHRIPDQNMPFSAARFSTCPPLFKERIILSTE